MLASALAFALISGCGDDDEPPSNNPSRGGSSGAPSADAGEGGTAGSGAGGLSPSAGGGAGGAGGAPAEVLGTCPDNQTGKDAALAPDGSSIAFVACGAGEPAVVVRSLTTGAVTQIGAAGPETTVEWLKDGETLIFGTEEALFARRADASTPSTQIGLEGAAVDEYRAFYERVGMGNNQAFVPRLLVLESEFETRRLSVYKLDDGYAKPKLLLEDAELTGDLSYLSDSGRTLVSILGTGAAAKYSKIRTDGSIAPITLGFGPADFVLAPIGLGDTHDYALEAGTDHLVRIQLETAMLTELVPGGSGLLVGQGMTNVFDREDAPGTKFVFYIQNGDITRRGREGKDEPIVLADADAVAHTLSIDTNTLVYLSDKKLYSVPALPEAGTESTLLVDEDNDETTLNLVFSPHNTFAYPFGSSLHRASLETLTAERIDTDSAEFRALTFDGLGEALWFLDEGKLTRVPATTTEAVVVSEGVERFWAIPNSEDVLAEIAGEFKLITP